MGEQFRTVPTSPDGDQMALPRFDDLPLIAGRPDRVSWGVFGPDDELGTLNNLTTPRVAGAVTEVHSGARISLQLPPELPDPPLYGRSRLEHELLQTGRNNWDDRLDSFYPQSATQWDGFRHVRHRSFGFYGGVTADPPQMGERLGIHHWAREGIVGRGVLLDVARHLAADGEQVDPFAERAISIEEICAVAERQRVTVRPGDILCVRTGWAARYKVATQDERRRLASREHQQSFIGLSAAESMAARLWDWRLSALAVDNPAVEVAPGDPDVGSLHRRLLAQLGMPLGELFDFDELADHCAADGRWSFLFISVPLAIVGGVGSPANPIAIR